LRYPAAAPRLRAAPVGFAAVALLALFVAALLAGLATFLAFRIAFAGVAADAFALPGPAARFAAALAGAAFAFTVRSDSVAPAAALRSDSTAFSAVALRR
jgi:hypothetical protein